MRKGLVVLVMVAVIFIAGQVHAQNLTCTATVFNDVYASMYPAPLGEQFCGWIEWFSDLGITSGCSSNPPLYCPNDFVTRAQMAVFVSKAMRGGHDNFVALATATVGGGQSNTASGEWSTLGGGLGNRASGEWSTLGGGDGNRASGNHSTVSGGLDNTASGLESTVGGGSKNTASGNTSFAAGRRASANANGCFVWGDSTDTDVTCGATPSRWVARASGGVFFYTDPALTAGVRVLAGASAWGSVSDRESKENFAEVDGKEILDRLSAIPIRTWNWKTQEPAIRHIGPVSQDFYAAFEVGEDDKHISTVDADGAALAAIQGLYQVVKEQQSRIKELETALAEVLKRVSALEVPTKSIAQK